MGQIADNTPQNGTASVATDDVTTLNGAASSGVHVQRVKVTFGDDGTARDASANFPFPVELSTDGSRTAVALTYTSTAPAAADTLLSFTLQRGSSTTATQTTVAASANRVLRFTTLSLQLRATVATLPYGLATIRINHAGAAVVGSPAFFYAAVSGTAAVVGNTGSTNLTIEGGLEISGTMQLGVSFSNNLNTNVANVALLGYEYIA